MIDIIGYEITKKNEIQTCPQNALILKEKVIWTIKLVLVNKKIMKKSHKLTECYTLLSKS